MSDEEPKFHVSLTNCEICGGEDYCVEIFEHMICADCLHDAGACRSERVRWEMEND